MLTKDFNIIVAWQRRDGGFAKDGSVPWRVPEDLRHFYKVTTAVKNEPCKNAVVMGRKTYTSIGKPLPGRINYVITRNAELLSTPSTSELHFCDSLKAALVAADTNPLVETTFVIGGVEILNEILLKWSRYINKSYVTEVDAAYKCDITVDRAAFRALHHPDPVKIADTNTHDIWEYSGINNGETAYLDLMEEILTFGERRPNRTGIDTLSIFGERLVFDISDRIPFLTTKRLAWKTMLRELLWFISGDTNNETLRAQKVHIWDGNSTREYLDSVGLTDRAIGDLGPVYGSQWRHFGAEYVDCHTDYTGKGVDQLAKVVDLIKNDPTSRRIIMSAWNPLAQSLMALPPCHVLAQWYVRGGVYLDCQLYQRSCDVALGVPFNIASYSVLTYMLAHVCGLKPGKFIHIMGDAHIYINHIEAVKVQLDRIPYKFPKLRFAREISDIDDFKESDFIVDDYVYHPTIKMDMAV